MGLRPARRRIDLHAWQRGFQAAVVDRDMRIAEHVDDSGEVPARHRIGIYVEAYTLRLLEVLENDFAALRQALGAERFDALARRYIAQQPSDTHSVRWFGRHFPQFLRARRTRPAWAAELAAFEWALGEVLDAREDRTLPPQALAAIPAACWPDQRLLLTADVRLLRLQWNAAELFRTSIRQPPAPARPQRHRASPWWVLWREQHEARWRHLQRPEALALRALARGEPLAAVGTALRRAGVAPAQVPQELVRCLGQWLSDGLIATP